MPEGFEFPGQSQLLDAAASSISSRIRARQGPAIFIFGRLARGATIDQAQAELTTIGVERLGAISRHARGPACRA